MLRAEEAIIPFDPKREPFLNEQLDWARAADYPIAVRLLTGVGGIGKTRLALELCIRLKAEGWQVGFLRSDYDSRQAAELGRKIAGTDHDCCVVLDYAETRQPILLALLKALLINKPQQAVRVLLLARDGGEWWSLLPSKDAACEALLEGTASSGPFTLPQLHDSEPDRQQAYQLALHTFAEHLQLCVPDHAPQLSEAHFAHPLYIQMAALIALHGERPKSAEALTRTLVNHERRYWSKALSDLATGAGMIEQQAALLMALATLANGIATAREIEKIWLSAGGENRLPQTAVCGPYPALPRPPRTGRLASRPARRSTDRTSTDYPDRTGFAGRSARAKQSTPAPIELDCITRLLRNREDLGPIIEDALVEHFSSCIDDLVAVCIQTPSPFPQIAEAAYAHLNKPAQSQAAGILERHVKFDILPLTGLDVLASQTLVDNKAKQMKIKGTLGAKMEYGCAMHNLSIALYRDGQNETALNAARQAVEIHQNIAKAKPMRFENNLATSLCNYSNGLADQGRNEEALTTAKQSLEIRQMLTKAQPECLEPELATSFGNYSNRLSEQGSTDEALAAAKQAVDIYQKLAKGNSERFEPELAMSISNYANHCQIKAGSRKPWCRQTSFEDSPRVGQDQARAFRTRFGDITRQLRESLVRARQD